MRSFRRNEEYFDPIDPVEREKMARVATQKIGAARIYLTKRGQRPYLTPAVMRLTLVPKYHQSLHTAAVDSYWRLYFDPVFVMNNSVEMLSAVIEHEIWHLLLEHHRVAEDAQIPKWAATVWNLAADAEIHNDKSLWDRLTKNGFKGINNEALGSPFQHDLIGYFHDLMERAVIFKTDQSYEVFINDMVSLADREMLMRTMFGDVEIIYKGSQVK